MWIHQWIPCVCSVPARQTGGPTWFPLKTGHYCELPYAQHILCIVSYSTFIFQPAGEREMESGKLIEFPYCCGLCLSPTY